MHRKSDFERLCFIFFLIGAICLGSWWFVGAYYDVDATSSLIFRADDGSCTAVSSQVGIHCFGDYSATAERALSKNPWGTDHTAPYLAGGYVVPRILSGVGQSFNSPVFGLVLYLLFSVVALSAPWLWLTLRKNSTLGLGPSLLLLGPASLPALMTLDRGNNIAFVVPAILLFVVGALGNKTGQTVLGIVLATFFKPQYLLLVVALVALRRWRQVFVSTCIIVISQLFAYLFWPDSIPHGALKSIELISGYDNYASISDPYPPQVSIARGLYFLGSNFFGLGSEDPISIWIQSRAGYVLLAFLLAVSFFRRNHFPVQFIVFGTIAAVSLAPGTAWAYYSVFVLPMIAVRLAHDGNNNPSYSTMPRQLELALIAALAATLFHFPLSLNPIESSLRTVTTSAALIPVFWLVYIFTGLSLRYKVNKA